MLHEALKYLDSAASHVLDVIIPSAAAGDLTADSFVPTVNFVDTNPVGGGRLVTCGTSTAGESIGFPCSDVATDVLLNLTPADNPSIPAIAICSRGEKCNHSMDVDALGGVRAADNGMFFDRSAKRLGIGTTTPQYAIDAVGVSRMRMKRPLQPAPDRSTWRWTARPRILLSTTPTSGSAPICPDPTAAHNIFMLSNRVGIGTTSPLYKFVVNGGSSNRSTLHFTNTGTDVGGWPTSVADNNFFVSSGAMWNGAGWVQKSPDGLAVMAGSGPSGYRVMTRSRMCGRRRMPCLHPHGNRLCGQCRIRHLPLPIPCTWQAAPM
ncbi:MAG: hypothetical protein MZV65_00270 [Chromatiales bacterium]|nr:hypothetical protein [Chromatiales bacterium]